MKKYLVILLFLIVAAWPVQALAADEKPEAVIVKTDGASMTPGVWRLESIDIGGAAPEELLDHSGSYSKPVTIRDGLLSIKTWYKNESGHDEVDLSGNWTQLPDSLYPGEHFTVSVRAACNVQSRSGAVKNKYHTAINLTGLGLEVPQATVESEIIPSFDYEMTAPGKEAGRFSIIVAGIRGYWKDGYHQSASVRYNYAMPEEVRKVLVNGKVIEMDVQTQILSGRVMVPVRFVAEALGCDVDWDHGNLTVIITSKGKKRETSLPNFRSKVLVMVNGSYMNSDVEPYLQGGRVFVPVRFVSEALGAEVSWEGLSGTVTIVSK